MNKVILIGRLVKEPELKEAKDNKVCDFTLAVNRDKEKTDFINCVVWNGQAETLCKYQSKGNQIAVAGEIKTDTYEVNNEKRYKTYILANNIEFLEKKTTADPEPLSDVSSKTMVQETIEYTDEDLPF